MTIFSKPLQVQDNALSVSAVKYRDVNTPKKKKKWDYHQMNWFSQ